MFSSSYIPDYLVYITINNVIENRFHKTNVPFNNVSSTCIQECNIYLGVFKTSQSFYGGTLIVNSPQGKEIMVNEGLIF